MEVTKTKVFKLDRLTKKDIQEIDAWLNSLRWVWNEGLRMLEELDNFTAARAEVVSYEIKPSTLINPEKVDLKLGKPVNKFGSECQKATITRIVEGRPKRVSGFIVPSPDLIQKIAKQPGHRLVMEMEGKDLRVTEIVQDVDVLRAPCCPVPWQYRRIDKNKPWGDGNLAPYTYFARKRPYAQFCRLPQDYKEPRIESSHKFALSKYFAHKRHPDKPWLQAIPCNFIRGCTVSLAKSWERYKKSGGGKPQFKSARDLGDTLINEDAKSTSVQRLANGRDGLIRIPKLGIFRVKHLWADWGGSPDQCPQGN